MPPLNQQQVQELAIADSRVQGGTPGAATGANAGDVANLKYAESKIGAGNVANIQDIAKIGTGSPFSAPVAEVSDGTDSNWDQYNENKNNISGSIAGAEDSQESSASVVDRMTQMYQNISGMTAAQDEQIKRAGERAGDAYNAQIEEARFAREQELPKDVVRAGQRGGFENTQMAGAAATQRTTPGEGEAFIGAGGILSESRQAMDRNISMIVDAQKQAIQAAEAAERKYIQSGKREDYNAAIDLVKLSNDMENDKETIRMNRERLDMSKRTEDRLSTAAEFDLISQIPAGTSQTIGGKTYEGIEVSEVDPFYTSATIAGLMKDLPIGETKTIYDPNLGQNIVIEGWKEKENGNKVHKSENQNTGMITFTTVDENGNVVNQQQTKGGNTYKYTAPSGAGAKTGRLLTLTEQKAYDMPVGATLQDAIDAGAVASEEEKPTSTIEAAVMEIQGKDDAKLDTSKYEAVRKNVAKKEPHLLKWFDETYPPTKWLDKNDPATEGVIERWHKETNYKYL